MGKEITCVAELPGVGEKTALKLKDAGYIDLMAIAAASPKELDECAAIGELTAIKMIDAARKTLDIGFENAADVYERMKDIRKITTGSKLFDKLLCGGVETGSVTEAYGAFSSGKSQLGFQLAVNAQRPVEEGGLGGSVLFIDTENTFRPERIAQMAEGLKMDVPTVLANITVGRAYNSDHQMLLIEKAGELIKEKNIKLVIVDSVTSTFRSDYSGRGELSSRQQKLNKHLHSLQRLADVYNIAVYITNQVMSNPAVLFGDPTMAIGGHIIGHFAQTRLYLRKSKGEKRIVKMVDSPVLPEGEAVFAIKPTGLTDLEEVEEEEE